MRTTLAVLTLALVIAAGTLIAVGALLCRPAATDVTASIGIPEFFASVISTGAGQLIHGSFRPGQPGKGAILLLHGIRGNRLDMLARAQFLAGLGYAVLLIDLPAHGQSRAEHISFGYHEANGVTAALHYLQHALPDEKIGVIGVSLGAAAFVFSTADVPVRAAVLESMYPTLAEATANRLRLHLGEYAGLLTPLLLWQLPLHIGLQAQQLRPIDALAKLHVPVLIAGGSLDRHTTLAETRRLFAHANAPKELWVVEGAAHVDLHAFDRKAYHARISGFLAQYLRKV